MKLKLTGTAWPPDIRNSSQNCTITRIKLENGVAWDIDFHGYEFEIVGEKVEEFAKPTYSMSYGEPSAGLAAIFGQKVKRMEVEFQEESTHQGKTP